MGPDARAIAGLIAPEFGEPVFGEHFLAPRLLQYVEAFLGKELRLGYVHLRNARGSCDTCWHRAVGGTNRDPATRRWLFSTSRRPTSAGSLP